ncbi:MAG: urocanate hydratase [Candidatus Cloacimonetes bacterium]|jgi:urocanate hydratase|nr:urocanate hydratase [Candidatus Cloacimonadota bacterium]
MINSKISEAMKIKLDPIIPQYPEFVKRIRRAPQREMDLNKQEIELALKNALRYIPEELHEKLAIEFLDELMERGHIYGYRFRPNERIYGKPVEEYKGKCLEGRAFQVMIDNNLDFATALYPYELVTYGETGAVCQNWMQYLLIKKYLENLTHENTLVVMSGHPLGLFRSSPNAPRVINTNGLMIGEFDNQADFNRANALGVANYGQMTAGGWMYIGPQGIVHGTYNTILIAGRMKLGVPADGDLRGKLFVSSGLGGMSGAQPKAVEIANGVGIFAEVDLSRIETRHEQGWVGKIVKSPKETFIMAEKYTKTGQSISIAYYGNIVDLLEYAVEENIYIDLLSDQTSCHAAYEGGYCPQGLTFEERTKMLSDDRNNFIKLVNSSLKKHYEYVKILSQRGTYFFDYGNSFMKAVYDAGVKEIAKNGENTYDGFVFPSYVEDILGPELFDYGYGPFRWVCLSGKEEDLIKTDNAAAAIIKNLRAEPRYQDMDNYAWVRDAMKNKLVVGTQARILYQDAPGRLAIALKFNNLVREGIIGPIMLGRDHHDTGGTDSPYRETSNIKDGSNIMAEMSTECYAGNAARGMSMVTLHNGGGVGIGKVSNSGFGMVLDGSERVSDILERAFPWDVMCGVARRAWARNENSIETVIEHNNKFKKTDHITLPFIPKKDLIEKIVAEKLKK